MIEPSNTWQRVSPIALLHFLFSTLLKFAKALPNLLPAIVVIVAIDVGEVRQFLVHLLWLLPIGLLIYTLLTWWLFRYHIDQLQLNIRQGVLQRRRLTLDFSRMQNVEVNQPWYFRPFGLAVIAIDSAGSGDKEVNIAGVTLTDAMAHRDAMLEQFQPPTDSPEAAKADSSAGQSWQLTTKELIIHGVVFNQLWPFLALAIYPLTQIPDLEDRLADQIVEQLQALQSSPLLAEFSSHSWLPWLLGSLLIISVWLVLNVISVIWSLIRYHRFELAIHQHKYSSQAGLLSRYSQSFRLKRLQRVQWQQNLLARWVKRSRLLLSQSGQHRQATQGKVFQIPICDQAWRQALEQQLELPITTQHWQRKHPASIIGSLYLGGVVISLFCVPLYLIEAMTTSTLLTLGGVFVAVLVIWSLVAWRRSGVCIDEHWIGLKYGVLGNYQRWVPRYKIQTLTYSQSPWQRWFGCASLKLYSAAGRDSIRWLPTSAVQQYYQAITSDVSNDPRAWM